MSVELSRHTPFMVESVSPCRSTTHRSTLCSAGTAALTSTWNWMPSTRGLNANFQLEAGLVADGAMIASYCQNGCPGAVRSIVPESSMTVTVPVPIATVGPVVDDPRAGIRGRDAVVRADGLGEQVGDGGVEG